MLIPTAVEGERGGGEDLMRNRAGEPTPQKHRLYYKVHQVILSGFRYFAIIESRS